MKKRSLWMLMTLVLLLSVLIIPQKKAEAKAKTKSWYGQYFEEKKDAKKAIKLKGNKITIKGKWYKKAKTGILTGKPKKYKKTFKLTSKTKYYFNNGNATKAKKISKKIFKKYLFGDVQAVWFKVKKGKITRVLLDSN